MSTTPVATRYTYEFIRQHLPKAAGSVLEIGCGQGDLAARLSGQRLEVTALDSDAECVAAAKAKGVDARCAEWPAQLSGTFDAVLFTRSLHHIAPLDEAVEAAVAALRPGGRVIVEDFRFELDSARTRTWFTGLMGLFEASSAFANPGALPALLEKLDFGEHHDELHPSTAIAAALGRRGAVSQEDAAYYFRYAEAEIGEPLAERLLRYELGLIEVGAIDPLGTRFVLSP